MANETSHKSLRPLVTLSFRLQYWMVGASAFSFHALDVALHAAAAVAFMHVATIFTRSSSVSLCAAVLFASHPVHTEAVANVSGRAEIMCALAYFVALLLYDRTMSSSSRVPAGAALAYLLAVLSKENGFTVVGVTLFMEMRALLSLPSNTKTTKSSRGMITCIRVLDSM
jgi:hypothetical protein